MTAQSKKVSTIFLASCKYNFLIFFYSSNTNKYLEVLFINSEQPIDLFSP